MAGLTHAAVQAELEAHVETGAALSAGARAHLAGCAECAAHLRLLRDLEAALAEDVPEVAPPPELRAKVLTAARRHPAPRRWWGLGAAAVGGVLLLAALLTPPQGVAAGLPDPAVVVGVGGPLLVASNDHAGTLSVVDGDRVRAKLPVGGREAPWFTEGVRLGERVFLADAAGDRVLEVALDPLRVVRTHRVPDGVAGLSAEGGRVYFKGVRGAVGEVGGRTVEIAREAGMPLADVMDGVLLQGGTLYVTHHVRGELCLLDPDTLAVRRRVVLGGMPVALAPVRGGLLVLDVTGRLLRLDPAGGVLQTWAVGGHPDKLAVGGDVAVLTDRGGAVTRVPLGGGPLSRTRLTHPMDVVPLPGGAFAVAEGGAGLRVLDAELGTQAEVRDGQ